MITRFERTAAANGHTGRPTRAWRMDLKAAYTLLTTRAQDVHLMGSELPGDIMVFFMGGTFVWAAMPFYFNIVTKAVSWELQEGTEYNLSGDALMYVDDIIGISFEDELQEDLNTVRRLVNNLLGKHAVAEDKTILESNGELDAIGYKIDLRGRHVSISKRNVKKAFFAAFSVGDGAAITQKEIQRVAAHCARYKMICPIMGPYCRALYSACLSHTLKHVRLT